MKRPPTLLALPFLSAHLRVACLLRDMRLREVKNLEPVVNSGHLPKVRRMLGCIVAR